MIKRIAWATVTAAGGIIAVIHVASSGGPPWALALIAVLTALTVGAHLVWPEESGRRLAWCLAVVDWAAGRRRRGGAR